MKAALVEYGVMCLFFKWSRGECFTKDEDDDDYYYYYIYLLQQETDELKRFRADSFSWFVLKKTTELN